ncbi:MAG: DUF4358 domain-containing protein [Eubacteriales bacterium]
MKKKMMMLLLAVMMMLVFVGCNRNTEEETKVEENTDDMVNDDSDMMDDSGVKEDETVSQENNEEGYRDDVHVMEIREAVAEELGENYYADAEIPAEFLELNVGITEYMYDEIIAEMPMISTNVDTLIIIKAKEEQLQDVEDALYAYQAVQQDDAMQYPANLGKIQASKISTYGNYVCFVQLGGDITDAMEAGDEAVIEQCEAENEKALKIIEEMLR